MEEIVLVPCPRKLLRDEGVYCVPPELENTLAGYTIGAEIPEGIKAHIDRGLIGHRQGYRLTLRPGEVTAIGGDQPGLFYGMMTLRQLLRQKNEAGEIPCVQIEDHPEYRVRGVMLDISRDRVPTMDTLKRLIDLWAELKLNQLQLYTEHTFAYASHQIVWQDASPVTPAQAEELDRYCSERAIELVPNQNSFGHMERWLKHETYSHLADAVDGVMDPWGGFRPQATTLNPLHPGSIELVSGLYDELLSHFTSDMINVGADEPFDLGQGRSKQACREKGIGRVYLDFMLEIYKQLSARGQTMQFYGDIVLHYPELIAELPRDVITLDWGYEAEHPFKKESRKFADAGLPFYVCPGTSSWNSLAGRWKIARQNIAAAVLEGRSSGAAGMLLTDWGDNGHWQQLPVSYPGYLYGAAVSWNPDSGQEIDMEACLSHHIFHDCTGNAARALMILQNLHDDGIARIHNAAVLAVLLLLELQGYHEKEMQRFRGYDFSREHNLIDEAVSLLSQARMQSPDAELLSDELIFTADLLKHAARLGRQRFATANLTTEEIPTEKRRDLASELEPLIQRFQQLWLARSRPGGLKDSAARMRALLDSYRSG